MPNANHLPFVVNVDDADDPADVLDMLVLGGFVAGTLPCARVLQLQRVRRDATLLPPGVAPAREAHAAGYAARLATGDGWVLRSIRWSDSTATLTAIAHTDDLAREVLDKASFDATEPEPPRDEAAPIG